MLSWRVKPKAKLRQGYMLIFIEKITKKGIVKMLWKPHLSYVLPNKLLTTVKEKGDSDISNKKKKVGEQRFWVLQNFRKEDEL